MYKSSGGKMDQLMTPVPYNKDGTSAAVPQKGRPARELAHRGTGHVESPKRLNSNEFGKSQLIQQLLQPLPAASKCGAARLL
jgi:hypothetical protein